MHEMVSGYCCCVLQIIGKIATFKLLKVVYEVEPGLSGATLFFPISGRLIQIFLIVSHKEAVCFRRSKNKLQVCQTLTEILLRTNLQAYNVPQMHSYVLINI